MPDFSIHKVADLFPPMSAEEYAALVKDIRENGQREAIWLYDGAIIDGRNRYRACQELGITPRMQEWDGVGSLVSFVLGMNLHRRHLTSSQKAILALELEPLFAEEAAKREGGRPLKTDEKPSELVRQVSVHENRSDVQAAKAVGTNDNYVQAAKKIERTAPELIERVKNGNLSIPEAKQLARQQPESRQAALNTIDANKSANIKATVKDAIRQTVIESVKEAAQLPETKYRVVYADPPWKYSNAMPDYAGVPQDHYPLMDLADILAMPIGEIVEDNAVLFLWATSPLLPEALRVVNAWRFVYKTSFVWDKVLHNMGHYNSVRHEFLLVCTRGSCMPDTPKLVDSVVSIERTEHSVKPPYFRELIDELYPYGKRIELFARQTAEGWDSYGNQL